MNSKYVLRIALRHIIRPQNRFLFSVLMIGISIFCVGYYRLFLNDYEIVKRECNAVLTSGMAGTGLMRMLDYDKKEALQLKKEAMASGKIKGIGTWVFGGKIWEVDLAKIQHTFPDVFPDGGGIYRDDIVMSCFIDRTALEICNLQFSRQVDIPEEKWKNPDWQGIYLGAEFKNIPLGTVYVETSKGGHQKEYEVIGFLEKGQHILADEVKTLGEGNGSQSIVCLDGLVMIVMEPGVTDGNKDTAWIFNVSEGVGLDEARSFLEKRAKELNLSVDFASLQDGFVLQKIYNRDVEMVDRELYRTLLIVCLIVNLCIIIMRIISNKQIMGIYIAFGMTKTDVIRVWLFQIMAEFVAGTGCAWLVLKWYCNRQYSNAGAYNQSIFRWLNGYALPEMLALSTILFFLSAVIPILIIQNSKPSELLLDNRG
ncbi:MAG: hypothetical protein IK081_05095 [Lachnospiraceae bacterium]|nr:hypothetical protein [Lachnospiraceae bacterium]MCR5459420.1 hypothetical protein [Acetatifactor sp.]